ncbi:MAG TPA: helix-turn-helix domain-containing protein [Tenuifilaceae bacterium]|nr:helix-turn-helix domain-containing protein [Tenuifilaceae bacterium]HPN21024.1 helix-turn-helix domain-containing protein [Tenuifilaceae bacterium]
MNIDINYRIEENTKILIAMQGIIEELRAYIMPKNNDEWLDTKSAAKFMGVSLRTIMNYKEKGMINYSKFGGKLYFKKSDLQTVIEKCIIKNI